jgi:hypothetical protein
MADADDDEELYGVAGGAEGGDVGLGGGGELAASEEAALEDEAADPKGGAGGEGGDGEDDDEDDGVDVIIDQEDLQTPGRPTGAAMWGSGSALVGDSPRGAPKPRAPPGLPRACPAPCLNPALLLTRGPLAAEPQVRALGRTGQARRAGCGQGGRGGRRQGGRRCRHPEPVRV